MKRLIIIAMMLAAVAGQAQFKLIKGPESKAFSANTLSTATLLGRYEDNNVWLNETRHGWCVTALDHVFQPVASVEIRTNAKELVAATIKGNSATLLIAERVKNQTTVYVAHLSLDSTTAVDTFATMTTTSNKDKCRLWGATSPSGNYMGCMMITEFNETKQYNAIAYLLDASGKEVHNYEYPLASMDDMFVTDDGRIVTLGYECNNSKVQFSVNYITAKKVESGAGTIDCNAIRDIEIVNVIGDRMIAMGTIQGNGRKALKTCGGVLALSYDLAESKIHNYSIRPFSTEDMNIFYNRKLNKDSKEDAAKNIMVMERMATNFGGVMALSRSFDQLKSGNDGLEKHTYTRVGLHVVAVDMDGNVKWISNLRSYDVQKNNGNLIGIGMVNGINDEVYIYKYQNIGMPWIFSNVKPAKKMQVGKKNNLVRFAIDQEGNTTMTVIEPKSKHSLLRVTPNEEIITLRGKKNLREGTVAIVEE